MPTPRPRASPRCAPAGPAGRAAPRVLAERGADEADADTMAEAETELRSIQQAMDALEVRTLLSGEYDAREALVSVRSGAGGVDAADFAEMLMRMYTRWAERHPHHPAVLDPSPPAAAG